MVNKLWWGFLIESLYDGDSRPRQVRKWDQIDLEPPSLSVDSCTSHADKILAHIVATFGSLRSRSATAGHGCITSTKVDYLRRRWTHFEHDRLIRLWSAPAAHFVQRWLMLTEVNRFVVSLLSMHSNSNFLAKKRSTESDGGSRPGQMRSNWPRTPIISYIIALLIRLLLHVLSTWPSETTRRIIIKNFRRTYSDYHKKSNFQNQTL